MLKNDFICLELDDGRLICGRVVSSEVDVTVKVRGFPTVRADATPSTDVRNLAEDMLRSVDNIMRVDAEGRERLLAEAEAKVLNWTPTPAPVQPVRAMSFGQPPIWWNTLTMGPFKHLPGHV